MSSGTIEEDLSSKFAEMYHIVTLSPARIGTPRGRCRRSPSGGSRGTGEAKRRISSRASGISVGSSPSSCDSSGCSARSCIARERACRVVSLPAITRARRSSRTRGRSASRRRPRHGRASRRGRPRARPCAWLRGRAVLGQLDRGRAPEGQGRYSDVSSVDDGIRVVRSVLAIIRSPSSTSFGASSSARIRTSTLIG